MGSSRNRIEGQALDPGVVYAINMRAAEAMVSSAPKPMKILPISEAWSQLEGSLLPATMGGAGASAEAIAMA